MTSVVNTLPDDLWLTVLRLGVARNLGYRDLCCVALASRRFRRLGSCDALWESAWNKYWGGSDSTGKPSKSARKVLSGPSCVRSESVQGAREHSQAGRGEGSVGVGVWDVQSVGSKRNALDDAPLSAGAMNSRDEETRCLGVGTRVLASGVGKFQPMVRASGDAASEVSWKRRFQDRFDKERQRLVQAHRREVMRQQSHVAELERRIREGEEERARVRAAMARSVQEARRLERSMAAGNAPEQVWEPRHMVQQRQQLVGQMPVNAVARLAALRQDALLLSHTLRGLESSVCTHRRQLSEAQTVLQGLLFRPKPLPSQAAPHQPSLPLPLAHSCKKHKDSA